MNREMRRKRSKAERRAMRSPQAWAFTLAANSQAPQTQEQINQLMIPVYTALDSLKFRSLDGENLLRLMEMFVAGDDLARQAAQQGATDALDLTRVFEDSCEILATIATRPARRGTGSELRQLTEAVSLLDQLVTQATQGMTLRALKAAVLTAERAYSNPIGAKP